MSDTASSQAHYQNDFYRSVAYLDAFNDDNVPKLPLRQVFTVLEEKIDSKSTTEGKTRFRGIVIGRIDHSHLGMAICVSFLVKGNWKYEISKPVPSVSDAAFMLVMTATK